MEQLPAELPSQQAVQRLLVPTKRDPAEMLLEAELRALQAGLGQGSNQEAAFTEVVRTCEQTGSPRLHHEVSAKSASVLENPTGRHRHRTRVEEERRRGVSGVQTVAEVSQEARQRRGLLQALQQHDHTASWATR